MPTDVPRIEAATQALGARLPGLRLGTDIAQISAVADSLATFGDRFLQRLFSAREIAYACEAPARTAERLAARFAAKEAAIKALDLAEAGIGWRDIEVVRAPDGACSLQLHRRAARAARGVPLALSLSHDGDYAVAVALAADADVAIGVAAAVDATDSVAVGADAASAPA